MRGSKFPADMHNYIWCPIYIPSFMIIGSVVSEELRWKGFGTNGQTDGVTALLDLLSPLATQVKTKDHWKSAIYSYIHICIFTIPLMIFHYTRVNRYYLLIPWKSLQDYRLSSCVNRVSPCKKCDSLMN